MRRTIAILGIFALVTLAREASADSVAGVDFNAPVQSFWGPGGTALAFDEGGSAGFNVLGGRAGVGFTVEASTGTVSGSYGGDLSIAHPDVYNGGSTPLAIPISFGGAGGSLATSFGARMDVFGFASNIDAGIFGTLNIHLSAPPFPIGNTLPTSASTLPGIGSTRSFSGRTNFDIAAFDFSIGPATIIEFGPTFKVTQSSSFRPTGISGLLEYVHRDTGLTLTKSFDLGTAPEVSFPLSGWWDFSLRDITLHNVFSTGFDGAIGGYFDVIIAGRKELTTANFNLFDVSPFGLGFSKDRVDNAFSIRAAPEPGTCVLLGAAAGLLLLRRRRRRA